MPRAQSRRAKQPDRIRRSSDIFRSDIRDGRSGTLLTLTVKVVNVNSACAAVPNANIEVWHCDSPATIRSTGLRRRRTYLRGIQTTNANGEVTFTTIYPGWYQGRATHIHVEVTTNGVSRKTTQIAFPESINTTVYRNGCLRVEGIESDIESLRRHLRRQSVGRTRHAIGRSSVGLRRELPGRDRCVDLTPCPRPAASARRAMATPRRSLGVGGPEP